MIFFLRQKRTCYDTYYPFQILSKHRFEQIDFEPVTILYGGNGTGKSTVLNIIAQKLHLLREAPFNQSSFYEDYLELCSFESAAHLPKDSRIITSDDVFDYMLNIRNLNEGIDRKREMLFEEYLDTKFAKFRMKSLDDYEQLKRVNNARRKTQSQFIRSELMDNVREYSNGESAFLYFTEKVTENAIVFIGRAGKQSFSGKTARAGKIYRRFRKVFWMPVCDRNTFSFRAGNQRSKDL